MISNTYKYEQLAQRLRKKIKSEEFPGGRFYTAKFLMNHYNLSQATLTKALQPLFQEGLLYSIKGKGTFINTKTLEVASSKTKKINCVLANQSIFTPESNPTDWFIINEIVQGGVAEGKKLGYEVAITSLDHDRNLFLDMAQKTGAMFIFTSFQFYEWEIDYCVRHSIPHAVYTADRSFETRVNQVWADIRTGMYDATLYLIDKGHSEIAFLGDAKDSLRHQGYSQALKDSGIRRRKSYCYYTDGKLDSSYQTAQALIKELPQVTAVVCSTDLRALSLLRAAKEAGLKVPEFAIIGFDNIENIYPVPQPLTTVNFPRKDIGRSLIRLVDDMKNGAPPKSIKMSTEVVPGSTA